MLLNKQILVFLIFFIAGINILFPKTNAYAAEDVDKIVAVDKIVKVTTIPNFETLYDSDKETATVIIENISNEPIWLDGISKFTTPINVKVVKLDDMNTSNYLTNYFTGTAQAQVPLEIKKEKKEDNKITPNKPLIIDFGIETGKRICPGNGKIVLGIDFSHYDEQGKQDLKFTKIQTMDIKQEVSALDAILKTFELPVMFLLPGFIFMTVFLNRFYSYNEKPPEDERSKSLFWIKTITVNIIIMSVYDLIFYRNEPQSILRLYGLYDIIILWCSSLVLALLFSYLWKWISKLPKKDTASISNL